MEKAERNGACVFILYKHKHFGLLPSLSTHTHTHTNIQFQSRQVMSLLSKRSRPLWGPPSVLLSGHHGARYADVKRPVREANRCPPSNAEVKNEAVVSVVAHLPSCAHKVQLCLCFAECRPMCACGDCADWESQLQNVHIVVLPFVTAADK